MGASSCRTINNAWARQGNAGPKQRHLIVSLGQSYSQTRGGATLGNACSTWRNVRSDKGVLLSNADNHVARHRRMLVPDNTVLISYKEASPQRTSKYFGHCTEHLPQATQSFHQTKASSCHTTGGACARQRNAEPVQMHLFDTLRQSYPRTRLHGNACAT